MSIDYQNSEIEQEALAFEIHKKISNFIFSNSENLKTIAQMLGASAYLKVTEVGKGQSPVTSLDLSGFIKDLKNNRELHNLKLPDQIERTGKTILPPDEGEITRGSGAGIESKKIIPRTRYLMEVLADLGLDYHCENGINLPNMMRSLSYIAFTIPEIQTLVLINDEEGNATFIIYNIDETEQNNHDYFIGLTKNQLKELGEEKVAAIKFDRSLDEWKKEIKNFLTSKPEQKIGRKQSARKEITRTREKAPEGWMNARGLSEIFKRSWLTIKRIINTYRQSNPEWFGMYDEAAGKNVEHYSPKLIEVIKKELEGRKKAPEGWMNIYGLSKILGRNEFTIKKIINTYRQSNPEWFGMYDGADRQNTEHHSPELIKLITEQINQK